MRRSASSRSGQRGWISAWAAERLAASADHVSCSESVGAAGLLNRLALAMPSTVSIWGGPRGYPKFASGAWVGGGRGRACSKVGGGGGGGGEKESGPQGGTGGEGGLGLFLRLGPPGR